MARNTSIFNLTTRLLSPLPCWMMAMWCPCSSFKSPIVSAAHFERRMPVYRLEQLLGLLLGEYGVRGLIVDSEAGNALRRGSFDLAGVERLLYESPVNREHTRGGSILVRIVEIVASGHYGVNAIIC